MASNKNRGLDTLLKKYEILDAIITKDMVADLARVLLGVDKNKTLIRLALKQGLNTAYVAGFSEDLVVNNVPASELLIRTALELGVDKNVMDIIQEAYAAFDDRIVAEWEKVDKFYLIKLSWTI